MSALPAPIASWFAARGWQLHPHQQAMLARAEDPATLLIAPTGGGKTLAGFLPTLAAFTPSRLGDAKPPEGLHTIYVSPLKALAAELGVAGRVHLVGSMAQAELKAREQKVGSRA